MSPGVNCLVTSQLASNRPAEHETTWLHMFPPIFQLFTHLLTQFSSLLGHSQAALMITAVTLESHQGLHVLLLAWHPSSRPPNKEYPSPQYKEDPGQLTKNIHSMAIQQRHGAWWTSRFGQSFQYLLYQEHPRTTRWLKASLIRQTTKSGQYDTFRANESHYNKPW